MIDLDWSFTRLTKLYKIELSLELNAFYRIIKRNILF